MKRFVSTLAPLLILAGAGCNSVVNDNHASPVVPVVDGTTGKVKKVADAPGFLDEAVLDRSIDPCQDFFQFACGGWLAKTDIPADKSRYGRSFDVITDQNDAILKDILDGYAAGKTDPASPYAKKLGDFYASCMDEQALESGSWPALYQNLLLVEEIQNAEQLASGIGKLHLSGSDALFSFSGQQDYKDASLMAATVDIGGLGLPERAYYLSQDGNMPALRAQYLAHITKMLVMAGYGQDDAAEQANTVMKFETALAEKTLPNDEARDPNKVYHPVGLDGLKTSAPSFVWDTYFKTIGVQNFDKLNVTQPDFFVRLNLLVSLSNLMDLRTYLRWHVIHNMAPYLAKSFRDENFAFYSQTLLGQKEPYPRWKTCLYATQGAMGEALGEVFVAKTFGADGKARAQQIITSIRQAFGDNLADVSWMDDGTRKAAAQKLQQVTPKIGFPDSPKDYSGLDVDRRTFVQNALNGATLSIRTALATIGKPVDRTHWDMDPQTVNAYYNPSMNEIVFPAGILQSPFYNANAPLPVNYGAIGMVMGHELTHGFDDQGRLFDGTGNMVDWWSPTVAASFVTKTQCIVDQFSQYTVADGVHINGKLTLGENIADLGGMKLSHKAYETVKATMPSSAPLLGFNDDQQFFVSYAQSWCSKARPEAEKARAATDPHSPPKYRVNGVLVNIPEFAQVFGCKAGTPMAPVNHCSLW